MPVGIGGERRGNGRIDPNFMTPKGVEHLQANQGWRGRKRGTLRFTDEPAPAVSQHPDPSTSGDPVVPYARRLNECALPGTEPSRPVRGSQIPASPAVPPSATAHDRGMTCAQADSRRR
jgi:hypothetical protein